MPEMSASHAAPPTNLNEIQTSSHRVSYERLMKAVVAIVVLLLCIVLLRAIFKGVDSVLARRTERETQRRALLAEIARTPDPTDGLFAVVNLTPMLRNPDSRQDVLPLARLVLPRITNFDAFQQLFTAVFPNPSVKDLAAIIDINERVDFRRGIAQDTQNWVTNTASKPVGPGKKLTAPQPESSTLNAEIFQLLKEITYTTAVQIKRRTA